MLHKVVRALRAIVLGVGLAALPATLAFALSIDVDALRETAPDRPDTVLVAQAREDSGSSIVTLQPPRQDNYWFTATLADGAMEIAGFVPDDATRKRLAAMPGVDAHTLSLARGEPAGFDAVIEFGLGVLARMSEGHFELRDGAITLEGHAASAADYAAIEAMAPPQGLDLAMGGVRPPLADPFLWSAEKSGEGGIRFAGFVPDEATRSRLTEAAVAVTSDATAAGDGAPDDFEASAIAGLSVLATLPSGKVRYDGEAWHIEAIAETTLEAAQARTAFHAAGLDAAGWIYAVKLPAAPPVETPPEVVDYAWSAEKLPAGTIALTGYVPNDGLRRVLVVRAGDQAVNQQSLGSGAPEGFPVDALAALDALKLLDEGKVEFADGIWSLTGRTEDSTVLTAVTAALGDRANSWQVAVTAPPPPPPLADPFVWSATKAADGSVTFAGYLSTPQLQRFAVARADTVASDTTEIASGAPEGFIPDVIAALDALAQLESGEVRFDGAAWSLSGAPATTSTRDASLAALGGAATPAGQWSVTLQEPPAPPEPVEEVAAVTEPAPIEEPAPLAGPEIEAAAEAEPEVAVAPEAEAPAEPEPEVAAETEAPAEAPAVAETPTETEAPAETPAVAETPAEPETPVEPPPPVETEVAAVAPEAVATPALAVPDEPALPEPTPVVSIPARVVFDAARADGSPVTLTGAVPADAARRYFGVIAGKVPIEGMTVAENLPPDFIPNADAGLRLLSTLYDGRLAFDGTHWYLTGTVNTEAERAAAAKQALIMLPPSGNWVTGIGVTPPLKLCQLKVASFAIDNPILFQSGSARMTDESMASLGELAGDLGGCPQTEVFVEGHTDADGPDDLNLALSVARAEAVVDALVELGVGYRRLYAVGYGESLPIADNETSTGKRANRRIVFTILEDAQ